MFIAVCGKPSVGKSSFFRACTLANVAIGSYPFTTIKSSEGVAFVRVECVDKEFGVTCHPRFGFCADGKRFVPIKLMDIPGLIEGSYQGLGRGNAFLADIAPADALVHIIDVSGSTNEKGEAVQPLSYDPKNDILFLEREIDLWIYGLVKKGWERFVRKVVQEKANVLKALAKQLSGLKVTEDLVNEIILALRLKENIELWTDEDLKKLATVIREKTKPMVIAANKIDIPGAEKNLERLRREFPEHRIIPCSADAEFALKEAEKKGFIDYVPGTKRFVVKGEVTDQQKQGLEFIQKNVLDVYGSTGVQEVLDTVVFEVLKMIAIFPGGVGKLEDSEGRVLPDCFLMPPGSTALDFAYQLHTDIGKGFIRAIDVKTKRAVGKEYPLKQRDVIEIVTRK